MKLFLTTSAIWLVLPTLASAQTTAADPAETQSSERSEDAIDEIVVTAQRQEQNLQRTPVAVTALSSDQLASRNVQNLGDLVNVVPSLATGAQTASQGGNAAAFAIRGLGQQRDGNGTQAAVAIYIDDFYYPTLAGNLLSALDIQSIEVLRGPQGTLFGRNTIGGAIRYQTRKPDEELGGYATATVGSYGRAEFVGALNVPLGETLAVRLTGASLKRGGWQERIVDDGRNGASSDTLLRGQLRFKPVSDVTIDLSHDHSRSRLTGFAVYVPTINVGTGPLAPTTFGRNYNANFDPDYTQAYASRSPRVAYGASPQSTDRTGADNSHLVISAELSSALELKLLSGRSRINNAYYNDADASPLPVIAAIGNYRTTAWSHELQASGETGAITYTAGVFRYTDRSIGSAGFVNYSAAGVLTNSATNRNQRGSESISAYANLSVDFTDRFTLTGGLRVGRDTARARVNNGPESSKSWDQVLPMLRAQFQWSPDVMTYASISKGFRAGGFNIQPTGLLIPFGPETVWTGELGLRLEGLGNRLRINPTVFYTDYDSIQIQRIPSVGPPAPILENAGKAHIYGAELEAQLNPLPGLSLTSAISYLKAKYDSVTSTFITTATPLPRTPEWKVALGAAYKWRISNGADMILNLDYSFTDSQWSADTDSNRLLLPSYSLLNARATYRPESGGWSLAAFVTNLTDETYFNGGLNFLPNAGNLTYNVGRPREFGAEVRVNF